MMHESLFKLAESTSNWLQMQWRVVACLWIYGAYGCNISMITRVILLWVNHLGNQLNAHHICSLNEKVHVLFPEASSHFPEWPEYKLEYIFPGCPGRPKNDHILCLSPELSCQSRIRFLLGSNIKGRKLEELGVNILMCETEMKLLPVHSTVF